MIRVLPQHLYRRWDNCWIIMIRPYWSWLQKLPNHCDRHLCLVPMVRDRLRKLFENYYNQPRQLDMFTTRCDLGTPLVTWTNFALYPSLAAGTVNNWSDWGYNATFLRCQSRNHDFISIKSFFSWDHPFCIIIHFNMRSAEFTIQVKFWNKHAIKDIT